MFSSFSKKVIYLTSAYSWFGENLSEGCPEQRKTLSLGQLPVYLHNGYHWAPLGLFLLESCFLLTLGISQLEVHYSVTSYSRKNFPLQETK